MQDSPAGEVNQTPREKIAEAAGSKPGADWVCSFYEQSADVKNGCARRASSCLVCGGRMRGIGAVEHNRMVGRAELTKGTVSARYIVG